MKVAVEGCAHGELNKIYECIKHIEIRENIKVDLLICCGDFQSVRDHNDMASMAVPDKYMEMKDFCEYYSGQKVAPILTIFIGGNHEASTYLWELPYGGWVAENIYYLGFAGVLNYAGIRIGGMSGIFKKRDYLKDHFEVPPFNQDTKRSFYHVRKRDVEKLKLLQSDPPDIVLSHDWPTNIYNHGNKEQLIRFKPFLKDEIENNTLGNEGAEELLNHLQPDYWFSGHMHAKFAAVVEHESGKKTKFLALDKCLPKRKFLQILEFGSAQGEGVLKYDPYWLGILKLTNGVTRFQQLSDDHKPNQEMLNELSCTNLDVLAFSKSQNGENLQTSSFCEKFNLFNPCKMQSWKNIKQTVKSNITLDDVDPQGGIPHAPTTPKPKLKLPKPGTGNTTVKSNSSSISSKPPDDDFGEICNPNSSHLDSDDSGSESNSSGDSTGGSSSSNSGNDDDSSDGGDDSDNEGTKRNEQDFPSFIETPLSAKTPISKTESVPLSSSTPFKWRMNREKIQNKTLSFLETSSFDKSSSVEEKHAIPKDKVSSEASVYDMSYTSVSNSSCSDAVSKGSCEDSTSKKESEVEQTPVKKFKLIRRNLSIYTPTTEED